MLWCFCVFVEYDTCVLVLLCGFLEIVFMMERNFLLNGVFGRNCSEVKDFPKKKNYRENFGLVMHIILFSFF